MTRSISCCILICVAAIVVVCVIAKPELLSDKNDFLHHFVNHEMLALLGIIMTITLASAASLHFEFNKIEDSRTAHASFVLDALEHGSPISGNQIRFRRRPERQESS